MEEDILQTRTINLMRFPLIIGVIFLHNLSYPSPSFTTHNIFSVTYFDIYSFLNISITLLSRAAVPCFFLISGYLFYYNLKSFTLCDYKMKILRRVRSLFLPYILWNSIAIGVSSFFIIKNILGGSCSFTDLYTLFDNNGWLRLFWDCKGTGIYSKNIFGFTIYNSPNPIDWPLWYLRDLIIVSILSPAIYIFIKKTGSIGIYILLLLYVTQTWVNITGFSIKAVSFFSLGAFLSINKKNIILHMKKIDKISLSIFVILFPIAIYGEYNKNPIFSIAHQIMLLALIPVIFNIHRIIAEKYKNLSGGVLSKSSFFIYALHTILIIQISTSLCNIFFFGDEEWSLIPRYIFTPFVCSLICLIIYIVISKLFPKITKLLTGYRF